MGKNHRAVVRAREGQALALRKGKTGASPRGTGPRATRKEGSKCPRGTGPRATEGGQARAREGQALALREKREVDVREGQIIARRARSGFSLFLGARGTGPRATGRGPGCLVSIPLLLVNDAEEGFADKDSFKVITEKSHRPV